MSDYTPSVDEVREVYVTHSPEFGDGSGAEYDRMIEAVRAEEREKAAQIVEKGRDAWAGLYLPAAFDQIATRIRNHEAAE